MPKVQYRSNCKPSTFAYPPALEIPKEKEKEKVSAGAPLALVSLRKVVFFQSLPARFVLLCRYLLCCFVPQALKSVWTR